MERYTIFLDWKSQYCQNEYTIQGNLQIQRVLSHCSLVCLFAPLGTGASQVPLSMGFSWQGYWRGLPCPPPGDLLDPGTETHVSCVLHWQAGSPPLAPPGKLLLLSYLVMSNSVWPHGLQATRLLHPWDFPGKSTGVGCHCLHLRSNPYQITNGICYRIRTNY